MGVCRAVTCSESEWGYLHTKLRWLPRVPGRRPLARMSASYQLLSGVARLRGCGDCVSECAECEVGKRARLLRVAAGTCAEEAECSGACPKAIAISRGRIKSHQEALSPFAQTPLPRPRPCSPPPLPKVSFSCSPQRRRPAHHIPTSAPTSVFVPLLRRACTARTHHI